MAENLLWPTKLSMPPQLLIDPEVMFNGKQGKGYKYEPLVSVPGQANVKYFGLLPNGFMIGFIANVNLAGGTLKTNLKLPFQDISTEILQYRMYKWNEKDADILRAPEKTAWKASLNVPAHALAYRTDEHDLRKPLFKMVGESLEDGGSKPQFSSNMAYTEIVYSVNSESFGDNLPLEFPSMFSNYNPSSSTLAIETVVKVDVVSATNPDGFKIGVVSS